ncbi:MULTISPECIES: GNAT family N-acetyltransferase [Corynebacterium]|uniref:GNAT family N-acetyltransferase n=1 Tax=Corynebacterium TaxID=1716 RepID=UPI00223AB5DC|nr:GNAT family N-acetyltransferase [Corynebacterium kefirresidentii]MDK8585616.1 GNAT family N-acetyltransferase [Corynebacterium kefirresidentii]
MLNTERDEIFTPHGTVRLRPLTPGDTELVHGWLTDPHCAFWGMQQASVNDVAVEYDRLRASPHEEAWILELRPYPAAPRRPMGIVEDYDPRRVVLDSVLAGAASSEAAGVRELTLEEPLRGLHFLVAPPAGAHVSGLTSSLFAAVIRWLIDCRGFRELLVEPDVANGAIHRKNAEAGFLDVPGLNEVRLLQGGHTKTARVQRCTASDFYSSAAAARASLSPVANALCAAETAERQLIAKAIREFSHERLLTPSFHPDSERWSVHLGPRELSFSAHQYGLEHLEVVPESIEAADAAPLHLAELIAGAAEQLGIEPGFLHTYIEEIQATLAGRARALATRPAAQSLRAPQLAASAQERANAQADYLVSAESAMYEGHPGFLANSGRGGMSLTELRAYAPEAGADVHIVWLAAKREHCVVAASEDVADLAGFFAEQLGDLEPRYEQALAELGCDPDDYVPLPLHPWQWDNCISTIFFAQLISRDLVYIGTSSDLFRPQQSLRTFFNHSRPALPYVKTAVGIRNMGFVRGLSPAYMETTPAINDWLAQQLNVDPEFRACNVRLLKEIVAVGYRGDTYHRHPLPADSTSGREKMLSALWRDSPVPQLSATSVAVTLAGCLYVDPAGESLAAEWIAQSSLPPQEWLRQLLDVYLVPVLHALAQYGIVFMPHSENVILELDNGAPVGAFFKDLGEEAAVVDARVDMPAGLERLQVDHGDFTGAQRALSIHTDVLDGVLRHLAALFDREGLLTETEFWLTCREVVLDYERRFPGTLEKLPVLAPQFKHSCLNRLQLRNPLSMVNLGDQESSLIYAGDMDNPLHSPESTAR